MLGSVRDEQHTSAMPAVLEGGKQDASAALHPLPYNRLVDERCCLFHQHTNADYTHDTGEAAEGSSFPSCCFILAHLEWHKEP